MLQINTKTIRKILRAIVRSTICHFVHYITFKKDRSSMRTVLSYFYHKMTVASLCGTVGFNFSEQQKKTKQLTNQKSALGNNVGILTLYSNFNSLPKRSLGKSERRKYNEPKDLSSVQTFTEILVVTGNDCVLTNKILVKRI